MFLFLFAGGGVLFKVKNRLWLRVVTAVWGSLTETVTGGHDVGSWQWHLGEWHRQWLSYSWQLAGSWPPSVH